MKTYKNKITHIPYLLLIILAHFFQSSLASAVQEISRFQGAIQGAKIGAIVGAGLGAGYIASSEALKKAKQIALTGTTTEFPILVIAGGTVGSILGARLGVELLDVRPLVQAGGIIGAYAGGALGSYLGGALEVYVRGSKKEDLGRPITAATVGAGLGAAGGAVIGIVVGASGLCSPSLLSL